VAAAEAHAVASAKQLEKFTQQFTSAQQAMTSSLSTIDALRKDTTTALTARASAERREAQAQLKLIDLSESLNKSERQCVTLSQLCKSLSTKKAAAPVESAPDAAVDAASLE
jgi:hypothetical protein